MGGTGSGLKRVVASSLSLLMAVALLSCGGGSSDPPPPAKFAAAMVDNQVFYRENAAVQEQGILHFGTGGAFVHRMMDNTGVTDRSGTWAVDNTGVLRLTEGPDNTVITLVSDAPNYMDVMVDSGSGTPEAARLYKTVAFSAASLPGRYTVEVEDLDGSTFLSGVAAVAVAGTGTFSDGVDDNTFTWSVAGDGVLQTVDPSATDNLYLLAGGSYAGTMTVVGEGDGGSGFDSIVSMTWTRLAAASGFDNTMVDNQAIYHEDTANLQRAVVYFTPGGALMQSIQVDNNAAEMAGNWWISDAKTLYIDFGIYGVTGVVLLADTSTYMDVLSNDGTDLTTSRIYKTAPFVSSQMPGTYTGTFRNVDGSTEPAGTLTMLSNGTGSVSGGDTFTWNINADGLLTVTMDSEPRVITLHMLAGSTTNSVTMAGEVRYSGVLVEMVYMILTR